MVTNLFESGFLPLFHEIFMSDDFLIFCGRNVPIIFFMVAILSNLEILGSSGNAHKPRDMRKLKFGPRNFPDPGFSHAPKFGTTRFKDVFLEFSHVLRFGTTTAQYPKITIT